MRNGAVRLRASTIDSVGARTSPQLQPCPTRGTNQNMFVIVGWLIVSGSVFGGFLLAGGHVAAMLQPLELLMIAGAATGAYVVSNPGKTLRATLHALPKCFKGATYTKALYMALMAMLFEVLQKVR